MARQKHVFRLTGIAGVILLITTAIIGGGILAQRSTTVNAKSGYAWKPLKIGGGGFVTGIILHPTDPALRYARTDVGGAYRWDVTSQSWTQLLLADRIPNQTPDDYKVESIALGASKPGLILIAAGSDQYRSVEDAQGRLLKSADGGKTWTVSNQHFWMEGNGDGRQGTERLVVDPKNSSTVYFGTRKQGLWRSTDEGSTWTQVPLTSLPAGNGPVGIQFVRVDETGPVIDGKSARIYASVAGQGIYRSDDAGTTWRQILAATDTGFSGVIAADQMFYVGFHSSVRRYDPTSDTWTVISPSTNDGSWQIAVSPTDPQLIFAAPGGLSSEHFFRSTDSGATWQTLTMSVSPANIPWPAATDEKNYFSTAALQFDPTMPTRLWLAQGTGVWYADNLSDPTITWINASEGIEETVTTDVIAPPGGVPVTTIYDRQGFYHANPDEYPTETLLDDAFWGGTSLDYSGGTPDFLVTVQAKNNYYPSLTGRGAYSTNGGRSWTIFSQQPLQNTGGNIAVSATDPNNIMWLPSTGEFSQGNKPYYTVDKGSIWGQSSGINSTNTHWMFWWGSKRALAADKVLGATFYVMTFENNGVFYVSRDGGATFTQSAHSPSCTADNDCHVFGQIHAAPGHGGHLWSSGGKGGLWYTTDAGETAWHQVAGVQDARSFGFGAPLPGSTYPAIYLYGKVNGETNYALWRSGDQGSTWDKLSDAPAGLYDTVNNVTGDMNRPGRVYVGFTGNGFLYGDDLKLTDPHIKKAVKPVLECVRPNGDGTYTAWFGTQNDNKSAVTIPVGANNRFSSEPQDRGQRVTFAPGRQQRLFSVVFDGSELVWTLKGPDGGTRTATASRSSASCSFTPTPTPTMLPQPSATPTLPPATTPMEVYNDAVGDGWFWFNWSSEANIENTDPVYSGTTSISMTITGEYGAVAFGRWKPPVAAKTYAGISFWVHGGSTSGTRQLQVYTTPLSDGTGTQSQIVNVDVPANTWTQITIPMSELGDPAEIGRIVIGDRSAGPQPTFYIDDLRLTTKP